MLQLSLGDWISLVLFCIFAGGILNNWVLKKYPNHTVQKLSATFIIIIVLSILPFLAKSSQFYTAFSIYISTILLSILGGVFLDGSYDNWLTRKIKEKTGRK